MKKQVSRRCGNSLNIKKRYERWLWIYITAVVLYMFFYGISIAEIDACNSTIRNSIIHWNIGAVEMTCRVVTIENNDIKYSENDPVYKNALHDAKAGMFQLIKNIRIDTDKKVGDLDKDSLNRLENLIESAGVSYENRYDDGSFNITVRQTFFGKFAEIVLPDDIKTLDTIKPVTANNTINALQNKKAEKVEKNQIKYTGLIVDARGINANPALYPRIWDEFGKAVFGAQYVSREYAVQNGMSSFEFEMDKALNNDRAGDNPLIVKGLRTKGEGRSDIIISNADASRIRSVIEHLTFLRHCRVVIVIDSQ